ncbi:predicted protein [Sclerotinia sclerotiorum 1980 UF-70]|uniref:Uncharacterized protein n=1 Tax=Sclerotinia sclerotiorum (strain ATCC 18683 / 1980 / Ss-1) TaxID=665079 RepID=A7EWZ2_SCLS1|nr:predicted protein [Sclerotinia sclerotiorum 1980 UF-70]EDN93984.1 predicted protein [Sclerotinia sclerotiorum 1980 UF-70]
MATNAKVTREMLKDKPWKQQEKLQKQKRNITYLEALANVVPLLFQSCRSRTPLGAFKILYLLCTEYMLQISTLHGQQMTMYHIILTNATNVLCRWMCTYSILVILIISSELTTATLWTSANFTTYQTIPLDWNLFLIEYQKQEILEEHLKGLQ